MIVKTSRKTFRRIKKRIGRFLGATSSPGISGVMDLRRTDCTPLEAVYGAGRFVPLVEVPVSVCRGFQYIGMPLAPDGPHPFVRTLIDYQRGECRSYAGSALQAYLTTFVPRSACESLGLSPSTASQELRDLRPLQAVLPWWPITGSTALTLIETTVRKTATRESTNAGYAGDAQPSMYWHGPFSPEQGEAEFRRLISVFSSIRSEGYRRGDEHDGDIRGIALIGNDGDFRMLLNGGQHRAASLSALGYQTLPVRLTSPSSASIIRRNDVDFWPYVRTGLFSRENALEIFDRIFTGVPSSQVDQQRGEIASRQRGQRALPLGQSAVGRLAT